MTVKANSRDIDEPMIVPTDHLWDLFRGIPNHTPEYADNFNSFVRQLLTGAGHAEADSFDVRLLAADRQESVRRGLSYMVNEGASLPSRGLESNPRANEYIPDPDRESFIFSLVDERRGLLFLRRAAKFGMEEWHEPWMDENSIEGLHRSLSPDSTIRLLRQDVGIWPNHGADDLEARLDDSGKLRGLLIEPGIFCDFIEAEIDMKTGRFNNELYGVPGDRCHLTGLFEFRTFVRVPYEHNGEDRGITPLFLHAKLNLEDGYGQVSQEDVKDFNQWMKEAEQASPLRTHDIGPDIDDEAEEGPGL